MSGIVSDADPIEYEEFQGVMSGDMIAVQVRPLHVPGIPNVDPAEPPQRSAPWYVFAGEVRDSERWHGDIDPEELSDNDQDVSNHTSLASIRVAPHLLWKINAKQIKDDSRKVTRVPPITSSSKAPDDGPPPCVLSYRPDQHIHLVVHEAQTHGRDIHHVSRSIGSVVQAVHGSSVDPELVIPSGYDPPE